MCCFTTMCYNFEILQSIIREKCPLIESPIFREIPSDVMTLAQIDYPWNSIEYTPELTGIPPNILLMSQIEVLKPEIKSLKGKIINQLQDDMYKRGFSSTDHNTKTIIDSMTSQTRQIMETIVRNTEVLPSEVKQG